MWLKADDGHFEYRRIVYFVVQMTVRTFYVTLQNMMHLSSCKHSVNIRNDYVVTWSPKKSNNFVIIKISTTLFNNFM